MKGIIVLTIFLAVVFSFNVLSVNCWDYKTEAQCTAASCNWRVDPFGGIGWCEQLDCWSFWTQSDCQNAVAAYNLSCTWQGSTATPGWCSQLSCWSYEGTNQTTCEVDGLATGLSCQWSGTDGQYNCMGGQQCNSITSRASCVNKTGCTWGTCYENGCWSYTSSALCNAQFNCAWNSNSNYCEQNTCYTSRYNTIAACENITDTKSCRWNSKYSGYCEDLTCQIYDFNQTGCLSPAAGLDCDWQSSSSTCADKDCWSSKTEDVCTGKVARGKNCTWETSTMQATGWCEKVGCWSFDSWHIHDTNQTRCESNSYRLPCTWDNSTGGSWCYQNVAALSCTNISEQRKCWDTMYCFWDDSANTCNQPSGGVQGGAIGGTGGGASFKAPSCGVFYLNETNCNSTSGACYYNNTLNTTSRCVNNISNTLTNGLNCSVLNNSNLCNNAAFLPRCCEWQAGTCTENMFSNSCWDNLATPPDGATYCEDTNAYNTESKCNQIANHPWYMPCVWNNDTGAKRCEFANSFFGSGLLDDEKGDLDVISNKIGCEKGGGGVWITETYCGTGTLSNMSITTGRCATNVGKRGGNCDVSCNNCDYSSSGTNHSSATAARKACEGSDVGFCEFISDAHAPNGFGYCKPKDEFKKGAVSKCTSSNCDACNMYQSGKAQDKCIKAQCEWAVDPSDATKGTCIAKGEQTCSEACSACKDQAGCTNKGRGGPIAANNFISPCTWDTAYGTCKKASSDSNSNSEICFNGVDDDGDNNADCTDNGCFSDPFCGGGSMTNCFQYTNNATCASASGCRWFNDTFGGWCDMKSAMCWENDGDQTACEALSESCDWHAGPSGSTAMCDMSDNVMNQCSPLNITNCATNSNCKWFVDSYCLSNPSSCENSRGWCGHKYQSCMMNMTLSSSQTACNNASNVLGISCSWMPDMFSPQGGHCEAPCFSLGNNCGSDALCQQKSGFCDPKGFGGGGTEMFNCWQYDSNQTSCSNQTQCTWVVESNPFCDTKVGYDCGQYGNSAALCAANGNCTWINESIMGGMGGQSGWCGMAWDQCYMNNTLRTDQAACNAFSQCNWSTTWNSCEPRMFTEGATNSQSCQSSGGLWRTGWCNPAGMAGMFAGMAMDSPPVPLGNEDCSDQAIPSETDICAAGIKISPNNWGLGISVRDTKNASMCNGVKTFSGTTGSGTNTVKFYWYLDTNGISTGGCTLHNNSNSPGWDLYMSYISSYTNGSLTETKTAYRCISNSWTVSNIQLNNWREKMCNELQGGMVALAESDMTQYEGLLNLSANIRIYMASANSSTNSSAPLDALGPVYYTPGTVDFNPECCWALSDANLDCDGDSLPPVTDPDCSFMAEKGYIPSENCWGNSIDEDSDTMIDCNDPDCKGNTYCVQNGLGVEAAGYVDNTAPKIMYWQVEKYPDSALLSFDSDEPTNGSVLFYRNDSNCLAGNLNATLHDVGIWNNDTPNFKKWHEVEVYNDGGVNSLGYALNNGSTYYFKLKTCDQAGHCTQSACSNLTTARSLADCNKCQFIFNMELPSSVTLDLDINGSGKYDSHLHRQCGAAAGFLVNYTDARSVNMLFTDNTTTPSTQIYLMGTRLTRTIAHNERIREINKDGGIKSGTISASSGTVGYAGFDKEIANKIVDKLHPKFCMINISGTSNVLYHCDDSRSNCVDKTNATSVLLKANESTSDSRLWKIPCEFSVYGGGTPSSSSSSGSSSRSGGGGGGGGGGIGGPAVKEKTVTLDNVFAQGKAAKAELEQGDSVSFTMNDVVYKLKLSKLTTNSVVLGFEGKLITIPLGGSDLFDVDKDGIADITAIFKSIDGGSVIMVFKMLYKPEEKPQEAPVAEQPPQEEVLHEVEVSGKKPSEIIYLAAGVAIIIALAMAVMWWKKKQ